MRKHKVYVLSVCKKIRGGNIFVGSISTVAVQEDYVIKYMGQNKDFS